MTFLNDDGSYSTLCTKLVIFLLFYATAFAQLQVNVRNKGGDIIKETIAANTTNDVVELQFKNTDGTLITQFIDFRSEVQIFRAHVAWEEEQGFGLRKPQVLCFVTRFNKNDFISSDAMSKLRQKNPTAVRTPEEEKVPEVNVMDLQLILEKSVVISPYIYNICVEAKETTFTKETDLKIWSRALGRDINMLMMAVKKTYPLKAEHCKESKDITKPCLCHYNICVGWYPCGLKYCRGKDSSGKYVSYRCGIKTCRRFNSYDMVAKEKTYCLWDDM